MTVKTKTLTTRLYDKTNANDAAICVGIRNAEWHDDATTLEMWQHWDKTRDENYFNQRYIFELDGKPIASADYMEPYWMQDNTGHVALGYIIHPDYVEYMDEVHDFILQKALAYEGVTTLLEEMREDKTARVAQLVARGYEPMMRFPLSELSVPEFDFAPYAGLPAKLASKGIRIMTLTELKTTCPTWMREIYDLECAILKDVPMPVPFKPYPFEQYEDKKLNRPNHNPDSWFFAIDTKSGTENGIGTFAGLSQAALHAANPEKLEQGLTGVAREYRRMGIATALKVTMIEAVAKLNVKEIETDNEENNPMYDINLRLGFKPKPAWVDYKKTV